MSQRPTLEAHAPNPKGQDGGPPVERLRITGNSLALRIPLVVAKQIHVNEGDPVTVKVGAAGLTVKAAPKKICLDDLLFV